MVNTWIVTQNIIFNHFLHFQSFFVDLDSSKQNLEPDLTPTLIDINNDVEAPTGTLLDLSSTFSQSSTALDADSILVPDKVFFEYCSPNCRGFATIEFKAPKRLEEKLLDGKWSHLFPI